MFHPCALVSETNDSDDEIYAGDSIVVAFNASGDAIFGPYDIDLLKGNNEVRT